MAVFELLILKSGDAYLRVTDGGYQPCGLDKASVFPADRLDALGEHLERLRELGHPHPEIRRLRVEELPLEEPVR